MQNPAERSQLITTLFLDIGGVLLTNVWSQQFCKLAAETFGLDLMELEERHQLTFDTYEIGKFTMNKYLSRVMFYEPRSFTMDTFREFKFAQSRPYPDMVALVRQLKETYRLKIAMVINEGRQLNVHRVQTFRLNEFVDLFILRSLPQTRRRYLSNRPRHCAGSR
ncbi:HAD family hydrolase [Spirosoma areae]